jgi:hypothetical protein
MRRYFAGGGSEAMNEDDMIIELGPLALRNITAEFLRISLCHSW